MKYLLIAAFTLFIASCTTLDIFEKTIAIKNHSWDGNDTCTVNFNITDTLNPYNFYLVLRHQEKYAYQNIWLQIMIQQPDTSFTLKREFILADNKRWLGSTIDDIIDHRLIFNAQPLKLKKGNYIFKINHIMREDPLPAILNVGFRVEKSK